MLGILINCLKGIYTIRAEGRFPERILNIASTSGIYVRDVRRENENAIVFCAGKKGGEKLLTSQLEGLTLTLVESYGLPIVIKKYRKRVLLTFLPIIFLAVTCVYSLFVWRVEIEGGDKKLQKKVLSVISENGVYVGALKHKIDHYEIKRNAILEIDDLSWLWVDVRGTSAKVKIRARSPKPALNPIHEPADVVATHSGLIEKMQVYCGVPLLKEGQSVEKGQTLITGVFRSENENIPTYYHHASGNVILRLYEKKTVIIPKTTIKKTPTGNKKSVFRINFEKNNINFSLNSGISYAEYDKIEKKYVLPLTGISFSKIEYHETEVTRSDTDISAEIEGRRKTFLRELEKKKMEIVELSEDVAESDTEVTVTFSADCRVRTDKEIPVENKDISIEGETDGENS